MLIIDANIGAVVQELDGINARLSGTGVFFRNVVRPRLLDEFASAYREAGIGVPNRATFGVLRLFGGTRTRLRDF